jgi:hypothetical protein
MKKKTTPGRQKLMRHEPESKKRKLIQEENGAGIYSGDTVSISSGHKTEHLPEAICELNGLEPSSVSAGTQYKYSSCGIGFLSVGFPSKKCSEQTNTCLGRNFLFKAFAHCNRIDSLEGIVCSLYGIIQEQSSCFCFCNSQKVCFHSFNLRRLFEQPLTAHELPLPFFYILFHI